jgi:hypothetical protein
MSQNVSDRLIDEELYPIEKGVPVPEVHSKGTRGNAGGTPRTEKYPWSKMAVGDSFFIPAGDRTPRHVSQRVANAMRGAEQRNGFTFTRRTLPNGVRVS